jgi:hypothetical protein
MPPPPPAKKKGKSKGKKSKGKGGKKKKKGGKKKAKTTEFLPNLYDIPRFEDPKLVTPIATLIVKLVTPTIHTLQFNLKVPVSMRVMTIKNKIMAHHGDSIKNIRVYPHKFVEGEEADNDKKLEELGINREAEFQLWYDFEPLNYPLLDPLISPD